MELPLPPRATAAWRIQLCGRFEVVLSRLPSRKAMTATMRANFPKSFAVIGPVLGLKTAASVGKVPCKD
jgi:hypothetical protein